MDDCCIDKASALEQLRERQSATLRIVLILNVALFAIELIAGLIAGGYRTGHFFLGNLVR